MSDEGLVIIYTITLNTMISILFVLISLTYVYFYFDVVINFSDI